MGDGKHRGRAWPTRSRTLQRGEICARSGGGRAAVRRTVTLAVVSRSFFDRLVLQFTPREVALRKLPAQFSQT